jgi:hypothetical protein
MRKAILIGLMLILATGFQFEGAGIAVTKTKQDPQDAMTECARSWNRCWDRCTRRKCYKQCNDLYNICIKIEIPG